MCENLINQETLTFAHKLSWKFYRRYSQGVISIEELKAIASIGLCEAANRYNSEKGLNFTTFAFLRIRGSMFDALRKELEKKRHTVQIPNADSSYNSKYSDEMNCFEQELALNDSSEKVENPEQLLLSQQRNAALHRLISLLPEVERSVLVMRYFDDKSFDEIAIVMGRASRSWVSTMHRRALDSLEDIIRKESKSQQFA